MEVEGDPFVALLRQMSHLPCVRNRSSMMPMQVVVSDLPHGMASWEEGPHGRGWDRVVASVVLWWMTWPCKVAVDISIDSV